MKTIPTIAEENEKLLSVSKWLQMVPVVGKKLAKVFLTKKRKWNKYKEVVQQNEYYYKIIKNIGEIENSKALEVLEDLVLQCRWKIHNDDMLDLIEKTRTDKGVNTQIKKDIEELKWLGISEEIYNGIISIKSDKVLWDIYTLFNNNTDDFLERNLQKEMTLENGDKTLTTVVWKGHYQISKDWNKILINGIDLSWIWNESLEVEIDIQNKTIYGADTLLDWEKVVINHNENTITIDNNTKEFLVE